MKIVKKRILEILPGFSLFPVIVIHGSGKGVWRDPLWGSILVIGALLALLLAVVGLLEKKKEWRLLCEAAYTSAHVVSLVLAMFVLVRVCVLPNLPQVGDYFR